MAKHKNTKPRGFSINNRILQELEEAQEQSGRPSSYFVNLALGEFFAQRSKEFAIWFAAWKVVKGED